VGRALFEECIQGPLRSKTVVLVTNALQYLPYADNILVRHTVMLHGSICMKYDEPLKNQDCRRSFPRRVVALQPALVPMQCHIVLQWMENGEVRAQGTYAQLVEMGKSPSLSVSY
jgi:hypothetical protein